VSCPFCRIAAGEADAVVLHEDEALVAFLDIAPVRTGHAMIVTRAHVESFELLEPALAARIVHLGQQLARRMKTVYGVERVAFLFTGGDVPHVHAHLVPMHEKTDVTSARYLASPTEPRWSSDHLRVDLAELRRVREALGFVAERA
jgi:histidine triad (HIT) family protein